MEQAVFKSAQVSFCQLAGILTKVSTFLRDRAQWLWEVEMTCLHAMQFTAAASKHCSNILGNEALVAKHEQWKQHDM